MRVAYTRTPAGPSRLAQPVPPGQHGEFPLAGTQLSCMDDRYRIVHGRLAQLLIYLGKQAASGYPVPARG